MNNLIFSTIPFEYDEAFPDDRTVVEKNLFGNNVGNEFFFNAIVRSLSCPENYNAEYIPGKTKLSEYNKGILIHANSIRNGTKEWFENDYKVIKQCSMPFVLVCVGTDSNPNFETKLDSDLCESIKKCYTLILDRTPSIGVRGEKTRDVLVEQVGIPKEKIDVIGCPSVRYFGKNFVKYPREYKKFSNSMKIAVNFTGYHYDNDEAIYLYKLLKDFKYSYVIFTDKVEAELLWYHKAVPEDRRHDLLPCTPCHFIIKENRARFLARQDKIMGMLNTFDFSIGSRIHQAIISILSGIPAILIAHSTRVLEIAQYHNIPYILRSELVDKQPSVETLYYRACVEMKKFYDSYDEKLVEYTTFLKKNELNVSEDFII